MGIRFFFWNGSRDLVKRDGQGRLCYASGNILATKQAGSTRAARCSMNSPCARRSCPVYVSFTFAFSKVQVLPCDSKIKALASLTGQGHLITHAVACHACSGNRVQYPFWLTVQVPHVIISVISAIRRLHILFFVF